MEGRRHPAGVSVAVSVAVVLALVVAAVGCTRFGSNLSRPEEPVVLSGSSLPHLLGAAPSHVVAFAWDGGAWHQVPVQVDERDLVNPGQILHRSTTNWAKLPDGSPFTILAYTPPATVPPGYRVWSTYTPTDSDPTVDANDEVSFVESDAGKVADAAAGTPADVDAASRQEVTITDPLTSDVGYVYLFTSPSLTGGGAGTTGVDYTFSLDSGDYRATYHMGSGALTPNNTSTPNPEHSTVTTSNYVLGFGDRWLNDGLQTTANGVTGADLLERGRVQFAPGVCGRSEDTFDNVIPSSPYEGAFIANISGPVRAIRSILGANSGTYTANTDLFYPDRQDSIADLRVHQIPGVMAFDDFTTGLPLRYSDDQNTDVPIDGHLDTIAAAHPALWQLVSGDAGSIVTARTLSSDIPGLSLSTVELDQQPASPLPCTGDTAAWGQNGVRVTGPGGGAMVCTDPTIYGLSGGCPTVAGQPTANVFTATRYRLFAGPNATTATASNFFQHVVSPLQTSVS
jgi:hypothetical protein